MTSCGLNRAMTHRRYLQVVASNGQDRENTCYHQTKHLPTVEDDHLDAIELLFLRLFRCVCATIASQTTHGWEAAHQVAQQALGRAIAPALVAAIVVLVRAIRDERRSGFAFMAADCATCRRHLSAEERLVVRLLRAVNDGDETTVVRHGRALAANARATDINQAARTLGALLATCRNADGGSRP